ncbi:hypothetical protein J4558_21200 [Leptolyngbya sp. 15MV]|nr:hypothetical protein J4558_21200 [Leptolyngbya sp. 15MV]
MRHDIARTRPPMQIAARRVVTILAGVLALILWAPAASTVARGGQPSTQPPPPTAPLQAASVPASRQATNVAVITIRGPIDDTTFKSVRRRIDAAERAGADALVFEIDTPGGEVNAALKICAEIKSTAIRNTIAWVNRDALSAGAIIALACREVVTNEPSKLGDALPVIGAPGVGLIGSINQLPEHERQKLLTPLVAELVESARMFGRDEFLVQGIVSRGVELWWIENNQTGRRVAINAAEYELIFGERPTRGSPTLSAAPAGAEAAAPAGPAVQPSAGARAAERRARRVRPPEAGPATGVAEDANPFVPASPALTDLRAAMRDRPVPVGSTRPTFSAADRGQWTLLEYISTGDGPFLFNAPQLIHFELATDVVRSDEELKAFLGAKHLIRIDQSWSEGLVAFLTLLPVRGVLLVLFLLGLFIEMTQGQDPGAAAVPAAVGLLDVERHLDPAVGAVAHVHRHRRAAHRRVGLLVADELAGICLAAVARQRGPELVLRGRGRGGGGGAGGERQREGDRDDASVHPPTLPVRRR